MHELTLAREILAIVERAAKDQGVHRIRSVRVELGAFGHVEESALRFAFQAVTSGAIAAGASLEITRTTGQAWCQECRCAVPLANRLSPCPRCDGVKLDIIGGSELRVVDMEVE